jgi:F-type H+-transporting ATPase subunit b
MDLPGALPWILTHALLFIILIWVMKKYAWGPVLHLLDERSESIDHQLKEVEQLKANTQKMQDDYMAQLRVAQTEARELVTKARTDAELLAEKLRHENLEAIDKSHREAAEQIRHEADQARIDLRNYAADLTIAVTTRFLSEGLTENQKKTLAADTLTEIERAASRN